MQQEKSITVLFEKIPDRTLVRIFVMLTGFFLGWLGTHYIVAIFYPITGPICIGGLHFHHLYIGFIILSIGLILYYLKPLIKYRLFLLFIIAFGIGMVFDDLMDHFILQIDKWDFWC